MHDEGQLKQNQQRRLPLSPTMSADRGSSVTPIKEEYRDQLVHMREHYEANEASGASLANPGAVAWPAGLAQRLHAFAKPLPPDMTTPFGCAGPKISREQMRDAKVPLGFRDNCAHLLIPLNE